MLAYRLDAAQKQHASFTQREMEQCDNLLLHLGPQIDQQIAAAHQIQPGKGRVGDQVLIGEHDRFAQQLVDVVVIVVVLGSEKPIQPLGRNVDFDASGITALAGVI